MAKNYFISYNSDDLIKVNQEILNWFKEKQYQVESNILKGRYFIQAKKTGVIRTLFGANLAFQISIYWSNEMTLEQELIIETSIGKWITNITGAVFTSIFIAGIPLFTGLANAGWALFLENELMTHLERNLSLKKVTKIDSNYETPSNNYSQENSSSSVRKKAQAKVQLEINKLEESLKHQVITKQEFQNKKAALEEQIDEYEAEFLIEEKQAKLQKAFANGVINSVEYELKVKEIYQTVKTEIIEKRAEQRKKEKIAKLKEAFDNGILTQEEYKGKLAQL